MYDENAIDCAVQCIGRNIIYYLYDAVSYLTHQYSLSGRVLCFQTLCSDLDNVTHTHTRTITNTNQGVHLYLSDLGQEDSVINRQQAINIYPAIIIKVLEIIPLLDMVKVPKCPRTEPLTTSTLQNMSYHDSNHRHYNTIQYHTNRH